MPINCPACLSKPLYGAQGQVVSHMKCDACLEREFHQAVVASHPPIFGAEAGEDWPAKETD